MTSNPLVTCLSFVQKIASGTMFRYHLKEGDLMSTDDLLEVLRREHRPDKEDHAQRQQLLLSNVAGFD